MARLIGRLLLGALLLVQGCAPRGASEPLPAPTDVPPAVAETSAPPTAAAAGPAGALPLALEPIPAPQGGQVTIAGRGFAAGETVDVSTSTDTGVVLLGQASASAVGTLDGLTVALPDELNSGPHPLQAVGHDSGRQSTGTLWIRARERWIVLSAYDVQPYATDWGFVAGGFEPLEEVRVTLEPQTSGGPDANTPLLLAKLPTDQAGNTTWAAVKPSAARPGAYTLVVQGVSGGPALRRDIAVKPLTPTAELSPWAGPPGSPVQFNAHGFAPNERVHAAWGAGSAEAGVSQADADGNLWGAGPLRVPQDTMPGSLLLTLVGEDSHAETRPEFKVLEPKPWLELSNWSGAPGAPVSFGGGGWIGGEEVTFHIDSATAPVIAASKADDWGWLHTTGTVYVPLDAVQDVMYVAVGGASHRIAAATFTVVLPFGLRPRAAAPTPRPTLATP